MVESKCKKCQYKKECHECEFVDFSCEDLIAFMQNREEQEFIEMLTKCNQEGILES